MKYFILGLGALALMGCQDNGAAKTAKAESNGAQIAEDSVPAADIFMGNLTALCGKSYAGKVVTNDPQDADWKKEVLTMYVSECSRDQISIPLHVGANRSRTWIVSQTPGGLRLKHDHRHEDGSSDAVTMYGGDTASPGSALTQSFPVDAESIALFEKEGLSPSVVNVWSLTHKPGQTLTYELKRPGRLFQAQFDLTQTVATPPPAWGHE